MIEIFEYGSVVQIMAHAPFPLYLELGELVCSGPVRIFSMIHHVTEKRAFCSCCGHWLFLACCVCMCVCDGLSCPWGLGWQIVLVKRLSVLPSTQTDGQTQLRTGQVCLV